MTVGRSSHIAESTAATDEAGSETRPAFEDRLRAVEGRLRAVETPFVRLIIAALVAATLFSSWLLIVASGRGLDLTDEGIYLNIYRYWRNPELTFTGAPVVLGPIFELLGWSVPQLRIFKLVLLVGSAALLGSSAIRYVFWHIPPRRLRLEKEVVVVLVSVIGSFSVYSWLPQSPGYNDLAIIFSAVAIALALHWSISTGRRANAYAVLLGVMTILLLFVKWPSAICTSAGITAFIVFSGRGHRFFRFLGMCAIGGVATIVAIQLIAGQLVDRVRTLTASSDTLLRGTGLREAYIEPYAQNITDTVSRVIRVGGPILVPAFVIAIVLLVVRRPLIAGLVYAAGMALLVPWTRRKGNLTGGEVNVVALESTFPIFFTAALGLVVLLLVAERVHVTDDPSPIVPHPDNGHTLNAGRSLAVGLILISLAPLLQAIGTGNPMFRIAFCAGGAWAAAVAALMVVAAERGGRNFFAPAACGLGMVCAVGLFTGIQGLWADSFRVGPLWKQKVAVPGVAPLKGLTLDRSAADLIVKTREVLERNGYLGYPGISTSNGTGLTFALGMPHPPSGLFMEEPLPDVMRVRLREACKIGVIDPKKPPVILSFADVPPKVATEELQACGVDFPQGYTSERVIPEDTGIATAEDLKQFEEGIEDSRLLRQFGITVWMPKR